MEDPSTSNTKSKNEREKKTKVSMYMTYSRAKGQYFLTDKMLKEIGEPDLLKRNPHYRSAAPMKLYLIERLENWIAANSDRVEKAMLRRQKLSKIQLRAHQKRREKIQVEINGWIPVLELTEITKTILNEARDYYQWRYEDFDGILTDNAICAFIRHWYTDYEEFLGKIARYKGKTGVSLIYPTIKGRVNTLIIEKFDLEISD